MKSIKKLSPRIIGIITGILMLLALSVPAFAAGSPTVTVKAVDEDSEPMAGVVLKSGVRATAKAQALVPKPAVQTVLPFSTNSPKTARLK